jgi:hypothetical protein
MYVVLSSESVFGFMQNSQSFKNTRQSIQDMSICGDGFIDILVRDISHVVGDSYSYMFEGYICSVTNIHIVRQTQDSVAFSFDVSNIHVTGTIVRGFVSNLHSSWISL